MYNEVNNFLHFLFSMINKNQTNERHWLFNSLKERNRKKVQVAGLDAIRITGAVMKRYVDARLRIP